MADKGKDGENYEFLPPDFDEDKFIHKEMVSFKTTLILFCWGIVAAVISWLVYAQIAVPKTGWFAGLAICAIAFVALRPIYKLFKADLQHWGRREWLGTGLLFFFTWLGIFIVAINPPISDFADPRVDVVVAPPLQSAGGIVAMDVFYADNDAIASYTFRLSKDGLAQADESALTKIGHGHYRLERPLPTGIYDISASARDEKGNSASYETTFAVVDLGLKVFLPAGNTLDDTSIVLVKVENTQLPSCVAKKGTIRNAPCVRTVHLDTQTGNKVIMKYAAEHDRWEASANFAGWSSGQTTFTAVAEVVGQFVGSTFVPGGNLTNGPHTMNVTGSLGTFVPTVAKEPSAPARNVPGPGPVLLAIGLLGLVAVVRRR